MIRTSLPTRALAERPDLDQLKRQAKMLLDAYRGGDAFAIAEVAAHYHGASRSSFALHDAQLVLARAYGFDSWPKLKAFVDGATDQRLRTAVRAGDLPAVRAMLQSRPELAARSNALHIAVVNRAADLVRLLMEHGANARVGIYPHRDATSPLTVAIERGYDDIAAIIREEETRRQSARAGVDAPSELLFDAIATADTDRVRRLIDADPALLRARHPVLDWTPLHAAARSLNTDLVGWLLEHGAAVSTRAGRDQITPIDAADHWSRHVWREGPQGFDRLAAVMTMLLERGAALTPRAAVVLGRVEWLRDAYNRGTLDNPIDEWGGLLSLAVAHSRSQILSLLLDWGFDPDERTRFRDVGGDEVVFTWGMPLWYCASSCKHSMAEMLLEHGADPNASVYASGTPMSQAYGQNDERMIALLERFGGVTEPWIAGLYRCRDKVATLFANAADPRRLAEDMIEQAACGGDPEIVRAVLDHITWPRDDPRWFTVLEQPLRIWHHGSSHWSRPDWNRATYPDCFRLLLERCDPNIRGRADDSSGLGLTLLHSVAGARPHVRAGECIAFATMLLDAGARLDARDHALKSTPLGWACRWGRVELVTLLLDRGADRVEPDAEPWATPDAWARKRGHEEILTILRAEASPR
ncbi:MAG TPA: ankyrin repeat domain-containing protein [Vicinamibacterales bacterium]|jgi:ankyrin repeat protein